MINNKAGPLSFSPPKVNVLFPLQHHMVTWRWIRLMIVFESSCKLSWSLGGFLFKHRSYSNQREHSCRYPLDWQIAELIGEFFLIIFES